MTPRPLTGPTTRGAAAVMNGTDDGGGRGGRARQTHPDPDDLFETKTVEEIADYSRALSRDIDRKREELRTMVGERYRDLMEAADTITRMKEGAEAVIRSVDGVVAKSQEAHARALAGARAAGQRPRTVSVAVDDANAPYLAVAAEIKLLMLAPEKMWAAVDRGDFLTAARLYLFARHIYTGLTLETPGVAKARRDEDDEERVLSSSEIVSRHFPVVSRQWASIAHFHEAILQGAERTLAEVNHETADGPTRAVEAMAATVLLRGMAGEKVLDEFLKLREKALKAQLQRDAKDETAKNLVCRTMGAILSTVEVLHRAFVDGEGGGGETLRAVLDRVSEPAMNLFQIRLSPVFKYLPAIVRDFCPSVLEPIKPLETSVLQSRMRTWLDGIHDLIKTETGSVLSHVSSISALSAIRKGCYEFLLDPANQRDLNPERWNSLCGAVVGSDLRLWDEFFKGAFRDRVEALVASQVAGAVYCVQSTLAVGKDRGFESELDLSSYLWSEGNLNEIEYSYKFGGVEIGSKQQGSANKPSITQLKAHGYSRQVQDLCGQFDSLLEKLLEDLSHFTDTKRPTPKQTATTSALLFLPPEQQPKPVEPFDLGADVQPVLASSQDCVVGHMRELLDHVSSNYLADSPAKGQGLHLFLGRFFQALPELCPSLEKCALAPQVLSVSQQEDELMTSVAALQQRRAMASKVDPKWAELRTSFDNCSNKCFTKWIESLVADVSCTLETSLKVEPDFMVKIFPAWDVIEIAEETEDGKQVQSKIQVPQHPSVALSSALSEYCARVYAVAPHSLPPPVLLKVSQDPMAAVCAAYARVASTTPGQLPQRVALQLHFDLQLVQQCFASRDSRQLSTDLQSALSAFEAHIDPFDLSVFAPHVAVHVKRAVLRQAGLLGVLVPPDRHALLASMKSSLPPASAPASSAAKQQEQHNVMWTCGHRPEKIPTVPVPRRKKESSARLLAASAATLTSGAAAASHVAPVKTSPLLGRRRRDKSPVARATGSFFEAMSTSWFGGK